MGRKQKRFRYKDRHVPPVAAKAIHYDAREPAPVRHMRRLNIAYETRAELSAWCESRGLFLRIGNSGEHFQIRRGGPNGPPIADWWPATAKLIIKQRWRDGFHCHDWHQVVATVAAQCPETQPKEKHNGKAQTKQSPAATDDDPDTYRGGELPPADSWTAVARIGHGPAAGKRADVR